MPSKPNALVAFEQLVGDLRKACEQGRGYHLSYSKVVFGPGDIEQEPSNRNPAIHVWIVPQPEPESRDTAPRGGERAGGGAFRQEDEVHILVHLKNEAAADDIFQRMYYVRADMVKAAMTNRQRPKIDGTAGPGKPNTFRRQVEFLYPKVTSEGIIGASVHCVFVIRSDHLAANEAAE